MKSKKIVSRWYLGMIVIKSWNKKWQSTRVVFKNNKPPYSPTSRYHTHSHTSTPFAILPLILETRLASAPLPSQLGLFLSPEANSFFEHLPRSRYFRFLPHRSIVKLFWPQDVFLVKGSKAPFTFWVLDQFIWNVVPLLNFNLYS